MLNKTNKNLAWAVLILIVTAVFTIHRCDDWTGFCEDKTIEESVEKNAKDQIQKRTKGNVLNLWKGG